MAKRFRKNNRRTGVSLWCFSFVLLAASLASQAEVYDPVFGNAVSSLEIPLNHSRVLNLGQAAETVSVGNPDVADIQTLGARKIHITAKSLGSTNVVISPRGGENNPTTFIVSVTHDVDALKRALHEIMPEESPQVRSTHGAIILSGQVSSSAKMLAINTLATQFVKNTRKFEEKRTQGAAGAAAATVAAGAAATAPTEVINLMQVGGPHQVILEVKVAEIARTVLKKLGINLANFHPGRPFGIGAVNGGARLPPALTPDGKEIPLFPRNDSFVAGNDAIAGPVVRKFDLVNPAISATGLFMSYFTNNTYFQLVIDASKEDGLAKILAEPTLTALSGESASFLSGGEFPIPVASGAQNTITIVFKEFGISVKFLPTVLDSRRVNLALSISVSELSDAANISSFIPTTTTSFSIPSLNTRSASSTVELMDGETIGVAGLISDKMREVITKFPGLGDVPILGALFRSQQYVQDQTELVMFVTIHLAKPIAPENIRLPTDAFISPSDLEFFLLGRMEGEASKSDGNNEPKTPTAGPTFGHQF